MCYFRTESFLRCTQCANCSQNLLTCGDLQVHLNDCRPQTSLVRSKERWVGGGRELQQVMEYLAQKRRKKLLLPHARRRRRKLTLGRCLSIYPSVCASSVSSGFSMPFICAHPWPRGLWPCTPLHGSWMLIAQVLLCLPKDIGVPIGHRCTSGWKQEVPDLLWQVGCFKFTLYAPSLYFYTCLCDDLRLLQSLPFSINLIRLNVDASVCWNGCKS